MSILSPDNIAFCLILKCASLGGITSAKPEDQLSWMLHQIGVRESPKVLPITEKALKIYCPPYLLLWRAQTSQKRNVVPLPLGRIWK